MFYTQFIKLCEKKGIKPTPLLKSLGLSATNLKRWENGATVNSDILIKISEYFDVSIDYLLGRIDSPNGHNNQVHNTDNMVLGENAQVNVNASVKPYDEMTAELIKRFQSLSFDEKLNVFDYIKNIKN